MPLQRSALSECSYAKMIYHQQPISLSSSLFFKILYEIVLDFMSRIERLHFCYHSMRRCMKSFSGFFVANTVAHVRRQPGQIRSGHRQRCHSFHEAHATWPISCSRSTVTVTIGPFLARCALVRNSLQTICLQ